MWLKKCPFEGASKILTELKIQQKGAVKTASIKEFCKYNSTQLHSFYSNDLFSDKFAMLKLLNA